MDFQANDVRITHPNAPYNQGKRMEQIYSHHEMEKKRFYNDRIMQIEKASFIPLIFTTSGGFGPECDRLNKRMAEKMCPKQGATYSNVIQHIRTRIRFTLLKITLVAMEEDIRDISFNLITQEQCYESF